MNDPIDEMCDIAGAIRHDLRALTEAVIAAGWLEQEVGQVHLKPLRAQAAPTSS